MTAHRLARNPISLPTSLIPIFVPNFMTTRHLVLDPISAPNSVVPTFVAIRQLILNRFCDQSSHVSALSFQSSHRFLSTSSCPFCCSPSSTDNSHIVKPPNIKMPPPCVGLDCSWAGCVDGNCLAACSHAGSVRKSVLLSVDHQSASVHLSA